jgi:hypothetical protein
VRRRRARVPDLRGSAATAVARREPGPGSALDEAGPSARPGYPETAGPTTLVSFEISAAIAAWNAGMFRRTDRERGRP